MIRLILFALIFTPLISNASFQYSGGYEGDGHLMLEQFKSGYCKAKATIGNRVAGSTLILKLKGKCGGIDLDFHYLYELTSKNIIKDYKNGEVLGKLSSNSIFIYQESKNPINNLSTITRIWLREGAEGISTKLTLATQNNPDLKLPKFVQDKISPDELLIFEFDLVRD